MYGVRQPTWDGNRTECEHGSIGHRAKQRHQLRTMTMTTTELGARQFESTGALRDLADIEQRLHRVECELELMNGKKEAHIRAKRQDARECIARGDTETVVVKTPPEQNDGEQAVSKIDGIVTFVDSGDFDLQRGDVLRVRIYDVGDSHIEAITLEPIEADQ